MSQQPFVPSIPRPAKPSHPVPELLARIQAHPLDKPGADFKFSDRLALENGWPLVFAERVIAEYRRFVYLACLDEGEVTPSDEVDQAWHMHLAYSRDYWEEFCPNVLGRPLHHGPTDGGGDEEKRYEANYDGTLELYQRIFAERPPSDIWPPAAIRFQYAPANVRVNKLLFEITPKQKPKRGFLDWMGTLLPLAMLGVVGLSFAPATLIDAQTSRSLFVWVFGLCVAYFVLRTLYGLASTVWQTFGPSGRSEVIIQPQHGYTVAFTVGSAVVAGVAAAAVTNVAIIGNGSGRAGDSGGGGSGCGTGGTSGCGSGCGGGCGGGS